MPADRAEIVRAKIAGEEATLAPLRKAERDARDAARAILMQEPFDAEKFKAALDRAAEADAKEKSARMSLLATTAAELTAGGAASAARILREAPCAFPAPPRRGRAVAPAASRSLTLPPVG